MHYILILSEPRLISNISVLLSEADFILGLTHIYDNVWPSNIGTESIRVGITIFMVKMQFIQTEEKCDEKSLKLFSCTIYLHLLK